MSQLKLLDRRAREVGQIKLGKMVTNQSGKSYPKKLDWFEVTKRNSQGEWVRDDKLHEILGPTPTSIKVVFFSSKVDDVFHSELALYRKKSGGPFCTGDQVDAQLRLFIGDVVSFDEEDRLVCKRNTLLDGRPSFVFEAARPITLPQTAFEAMLDEMPELKRVETPEGIVYWQCLVQKAIIECIGCESLGCPLTASDDQKCQCKPKGMLRVMLMDAPSFGAHHCLRTGSWNSIQSLLATLEMVVERVGSLEGIPFNLKCQHENIQTREGRNQKVNVAHLEVIGTLSTMLEIAAEHANRRLELGSTQAALLPPVPMAEAVKNAEEGFADEFHPDLPEQIEDAVVEPVDDGPRLDDDMNQDRGSDIPEDKPGAFALPAAEEPDKDLDISQDQAANRAQTEGIITPAPEDDVQAAPEVPEFDI